MLGCNLKLTRNVASYKLAEEGVVAVVNKVVEANTRPYEHLFDAVYPLDIAKKGCVFGMIDLEIFTRRRREAFSARTNTVFLLLLARGVSKVCGRAANVVYIALEIRHFCDNMRLAHNAFVATGAHLSALMKGESTEVTSAKAAAVVGYREFYLGYCGNMQSGDQCMIRHVISACSVT